MTVTRPRRRRRSRDDLPCMLACMSVLRDLRDALPALRTSADDADRVAYARDLWPRHHLRVRAGRPAEHRPEAIAWPTSTAEVAELVRWARERARPARPVRRRQRRVRRRAAARPNAVVVDLKRMARIRAIDAGRPVRRRRGGPHGRAAREDAAAGRLHARPLSRRRSSAAPSAAGSRRGARASAPGRTARSRTWSPSLECVTGAGEVVELRRRVSGPDLVPLVVGSEGTLAIVTSAQAPPAPGADVARLRRVVVPDDVARPGGDARDLPGRPAPRRRAPLRSVRRDAREARRREDRRRDETAPRARPRRRGAPRDPEAARGAQRAPALGRAARALGGAMLVVVFEGSGEAPRRGIEHARRIVEARLRGSWEGEAPARALARAPLRGELPAGAGLRERRLRRHDGGRGVVVEARGALRRRAARARRARVRDGALQPRVPRRVLHLLLVRGQRRRASRAASGLGRRVRGHLRPRLASGAEGRGRRGRHARAPSRRRPLEGAAAGRRAGERRRRGAGADAGVRSRRDPEPGQPDSSGSGPRSSAPLSRPRVPPHRPPRRRSRPHEPPRAGRSGDGARRPRAAPQRRRAHARRTRRHARAHRRRVARARRTRRARPLARPRRPARRGARRDARRRAGAAHSPRAATLGRAGPLRALRRRRDPLRTHRPRRGCACTRWACRAP